MGPPTTCVIDGTTFDAQAQNPAPAFGPCQVCRPEVRPDAWTLAPLGTACGDARQCISGGRCARVFQSVPETGTSTWYDVGGTASELWVVGPTSTALRSSDRGTTWSRLSLPGLQYRYGVFSPAPGQAVVVGTEGSVLTTQNAGMSWSPSPAPMDRVLRGIWGRSATEWYVVGAGGFIARTTTAGQTWQPLRTTADGGREQTLFGIAGSGATLLAVGEAGLVVRSTDGVAFTQRTVGTTASLFAVAATGLAFYVVGSSGTVLRSPDGVTFTSVQVPTSADVTDVWGSGADVFISTADGDVFASEDDGATWRPLATNGAQVLNAVWGTSATDVYAVGVSGVVLRTP
jgi:photosystem II stability/assembly factor-like uncharacterized protein